MASILFKSANKATKHLLGVISVKSFSDRNQIPTSAAVKL
ncbi:Uncharacterised protein [Vibrio cholerae]|nr:Uncharacterised protein [Vibrio cholerae]